MSTPKKHGKIVDKALRKDERRAERDVVKLNEAADRPARTSHSRAGQVVVRASADNPFELARSVARHAASEYVLALADPIGQPACRAPDLFAFPTAVWKTTRVTRVKVAPLPGSGAAAPNYGVLGVVSPLLRNKIRVGTVLASGRWSGDQGYDDPSYTTSGGGVSDTTVYGYRCTAMSARFTCSASALNAAGSLRVLCVSGSDTSTVSWGSIIGKLWGVLDSTRACVVDPRGSDLGSRQYCWSWATNNDLDYRLPSSTTNTGPVIVFELGTESSVMEMTVEVTSHYQGIPSPQQAMLMPTEPSANATWDDVHDVIAASSVARDMGASRNRPYNDVKEDESTVESGLADGWSDTLFRGVKKVMKVAAPAAHDAISSIRHAMTPFTALADAGDDEGNGDDELAARTPAAPRPAGGAWDPHDVPSTAALLAEQHRAAARRSA